MNPIPRKALLLLLLFAIPGYLIPSGYFLWWLSTDAASWSAVLQNKLAMAFIADIVFTTAVIAVYFAYHPPPKLRWPWFLVISYLTTLAVGFVIYWWLSVRNLHTAEPGDTDGTT